MEVLESILIYWKKCGIVFIPLILVCFFAVNHFFILLKNTQKISGEKQLFDCRLRILWMNRLLSTAPLFGLLGTILGMIHTFTWMGAGQLSAGKGIAEGLSEALISTQIGLLVLIPGLFASLYCHRRVKKFISMKQEIFQ